MAVGQKDSWFAYEAPPQAKCDCRRLQGAGQAVSHIPT